MSEDHDGLGENVSDSTGWIATVSHATTQFDPSYNTAADISIAVILVICFVIGTFLNTIAIIYFGIMNFHDYRQRRKHVRRAYKKLLYGGIYFLNSFNDMLVCGTILPVAVGFFNNRNQMWFKDFTFCSVWGALWEFLPYTSIMYIAALSLTRTFHLMFPLKYIPLKVVWGIMGTYTGFLVGRTMVPIFSRFGTFTFHKDSMYCFEWARLRYSSYVMFAEFSDILQLVLPMVPILASCITSTIIISISRRSRREVSSSTRAMKQQASNTILLITLLYIVFNIPVIALCVLYTISFVNHRKYHEIFNTAFLYWYSWGCVYILGIALNALLNPILYIWRMRRFREFCIQWLGNKAPITKYVRSSTSTITFFLGSVSSKDYGVHAKISAPMMPDLKEDQAGTSPDSEGTGSGTVST